MLIWLVLGVLVVGLAFVVNSLERLHDKLDRLYAYFREFDGGVARGFDAVDAGIGQIRREVTADRCESGGCKRRATWKIVYEGGSTIYTCSEHDNWGDSTSVSRHRLS